MMISVGVCERERESERETVTRAGIRPHKLRGTSFVNGSMAHLSKSLEH